MDDNSIYRDLFFEETDENLSVLNREVLQLEQQPNDLTIIDAIFRAAHTLKGMASTMGYTQMASVTHAVETLFEQVKNQELSVTTSLISLVFDSLDVLSQLVEGLRSEDDTVIDTTQLVKKLEAASERDGHMELDGADEWVFPVLNESHYSAIEHAESSGYTLYAIKAQISSDSLLKAARAFMLVNKLNDVGDVLHTNPNEEGIEQGDMGERITLYCLSKEEFETIEHHVMNVSEIEHVTIEPTAGNKVKRAQDTASLDAHHDITVNTPETHKMDTPETNQSTKKRPVAKQTIRVDLSRLDQFMNLVSELVIHRTRLEDVSEKNALAELNEPLTQVGRITTELQELVLQLRMQPFSVVTQRFPRMMRDLTNELGKDIQFVTEGESTELDRTVISEIGEPLIHLLRNAADHGVELPDEREKAGKPRTGTITLSAYPEGNRVIVTLEDDGKGLDPRILEKSAAKKGINTNGMTDTEIQELIFHPGFSTADSVTNISGRGVGMDAVKAKINELNGKIETVSQVGVGTRFTITLPLTLSIIQSLLVTVGNETFAIPQAVIDKIKKYESTDVHRVHQSEVYDFEGQTVPLVRLSEVLNVSSNEEEQHIIFVLIGQQRYALVVDTLVQQKEIVIKKLGRELSELSHFLGATILGDGRISLIVDVTSLCAPKIGEYHA